jgi:hypothetical protein
MLSIAILTLCGFGQATWQSFNTAEASGYEVFAGGERRPFEVTKSKEVVTFTFARALHGRLSNLRRVERIATNRIDTWLADDPKRALRLYEPSRSDLTTWLKPPGFAPDTLVKDPEAVARVLGASVSYGGKEAVGGRDCHVLNVGGRPAQKLWIDSATGVTLRFRQFDASGVMYERSLEDFKVGSAAVEITPGNRTLLQGMPDPDILRKADAPQTREQYSAEIKKAKEKLKAFTGDWIRTLPQVAGFDPIQSFVEQRDGKKVDTVWPANRLGGPEFEPGGLPTGYTVEGRVDPKEDRILFDMYEFGEPRIHAIIGIPKPGEDNKWFSVSQHLEKEVKTTEYVAYIAPDGRLVIAPGRSAKAAEERRRQRYEQLSGASAIVWSDFLDDLGETITLIQMRNKNWKAALRMPALPPHVEIAAKAPRLPLKVDSYAMPGLTLLHWNRDGADYVASSSSKSPAQLLELLSGLE